jgi:hypothetical protein
MQMHKHKYKLIIASLAVLAAQLIIPQFVPTANASTAFSGILFRLDRMKELTATGGTICAKTPTSYTGAGTENKVTVTFPKQPVGTNFAYSSTATDWSVAGNTSVVDPVSGGLTTTAWPSITAPAVNGDIAPDGNGNVTVTFGSGALTANKFYCFDFFPTVTSTPIMTNGSKYDPNAVGAKSLTGRIQTKATATVISDTQYAVDIVGNDQIVVTAVVPPIFTMDLQAIGGTPGAYTGVDAFASDLSVSGAIFTSGVEAVITTNAPRGWVSWVKSANRGLTSAIAGGYRIPTVDDGSSTPGDGLPANVALASATRQYGAYGLVSSSPVGSCAPAIDPIYDPHLSGGNPTTIGTLYASYIGFASCIGTSPATADNTKVQIFEGARITPSVPAASDYTDTLTMVGAGNF